MHFASGKKRKMVHISRRLAAEVLLLVEATRDFTVLAGTAALVRVHGYRKANFKRCHILLSVRLPHKENPPHFCFTPLHISKDSLSSSYIFLNIEFAT